MAQRSSLKHVPFERALLAPCARAQRTALRSHVARKITTASDGHSHPHRPGDAHQNVMNDIRSHLKNSRVLTNVGIVDTLRRWYPDHLIIQTSKSTGLLELASDGQAQATLDVGADLYGSRRYNKDLDDMKML